MCVCMCVCMYVCLYVCMSVYVYCVCILLWNEKSMLSIDDEDFYSVTLAFRQNTGNKADGGQ